MFRKQRSGRYPDGFLAFEFFNYFVGGNIEVFLSSKILTDFTNSDVNLDVSSFFYTALPEPLQPKIEVIRFNIHCISLDIVAGWYIANRIVLF